MKPNQQQIETEIATLKAIKPKVRKHTAFGDNNHDAIDAQIEVLEGRMTEAKVFDRFESSGSDDCDYDENRGERALDMALEAFRWMDGENEEAPSVGWKELTQP